MAKIAIVFDGSNENPNSTVCPFWLRIENLPSSIDVVELDAHSLPEAYRKALAAGYDATAWISGGVEMAIPSGIDHMRRSALELGLIR
ncbi:MAG: hypothetical protein EOO77_29735 [Oxalobacteraceae bacterium]|nr:MAG: hypothetical protein EOO77_29735 [Oxalobacteraceae bacterium]